MDRVRTTERGAALLVVTVAVAVLTALAVDLAYEARVSLRIAANARDELRATYLAKGGVAMARLVLSFQQEVEGAIPPIPGLPAVPRPQLWKLAPVDSALADGLLGEEARERPEDGAPPAGPADGDFQVDVDDEGRKVNAQLEGTGTGTLPFSVQAFYQLVCDPRWDPLFDREDANGLRVSRPDLLVYLRDWVDDEVPPTSSALAASFAPSGCAVAVAQNPFEPGFGDENYAYDRGEDRYRAKNARMDSLDELYLVAGIGDAFMAAFGESLTVYLPRDAKPNVNTLDPVALLLRARTMALAPDDPALGDLAFVERLQKAVVERTLGGALSITPAEQAQLVEAAGVRVNPAFLQEGSQQNPFTDRSTVFRLRAAGRAGDVTKTLDVVVRVEAIGPTTSTPGRIVHWREE